jgi:hypothetical protein
MDRTLNDIVARAASEIADAVRGNIADEVARLVGGRATVARGPGRPGRPPGRRRRVILCPVPKCGKPGGGPKWGWFCKDHKDLPASEKAKARAASRPNVRSAAKQARKKK